MISRNALSVQMLSILQILYLYQSLLFSSKDTLDNHLTLFIIIISLLFEDNEQIFLLSTLPFIARNPQLS